MPSTCSRPAGSLCQASATPSRRAGSRRPRSSRPTAGYRRPSCWARSRRSGRRRSSAARHRPLSCWTSRRRTRAWSSRRGARWATPPSLSGALPLAAWVSSQTPWASPRMRRAPSQRPRRTPSTWWVTACPRWSPALMTASRAPPWTSRRRVSPAPLATAWPTPWTWSPTLSATPCTASPAASAGRWTTSPVRVARGRRASRRTSSPSLSRSSSATSAPWACAWRAAW
mmetsp:Transcript_95662/g.254008  ORF Transcript_95662/g.254008 Transcript_95662/m.254008 type:complete len:228 (-) Transcript_95662:460-1143(-)